MNSLRITDYYEPTDLCRDPIVRGLQLLSSYNGILDPEYGAPGLFVLIDKPIISQDKEELISLGWKVYDEEASDPLEICCSYTEHNKACKHILFFRKLQRYMRKVHRFLSFQ